MIDVTFDDVEMGLALNGFDLKEVGSSYEVSPTLTQTPTYLFDNLSDVLMFNMGVEAHKRLKG